MKNCIVMAVCLFGKGVTNAITVLWMIIESRFKFEFFTLPLQWPYPGAHCKNVIHATEKAAFLQLFRELSKDSFANVENFWQNPATKS